MAQDDQEIYEGERDVDLRDPDETPIRNRKVITQPYDLSVDSLSEQISEGTIFLRPLNDRPNFQRKYVWTDELASRLIESILLNVPVPPCYLSQNEDFELDVIDGQQRLYSIYRFLNNQFKLQKLDVLTELNGLQFYQLPSRTQRQIKTHTLRCVLITNESHPEIKFDVFERLNTNTVPLNPQELRNCVYRGSLNTYLQEASEYSPWLKILGKKQPDKRLRDEELILRFFAFHNLGIESYRTPQKFWLNDAAKDGRSLSENRIEQLRRTWTNTIDVCLIIFDSNKCFRRPGSKSINKALFDLITYSTRSMEFDRATNVKEKFIERFDLINEDNEFKDLISRAVDHKKRTLRRFELWQKFVGPVA